jgi:hypothetical protein
VFVSPSPHSSTKSTAPLTKGAATTPDTTGAAGDAGAIAQTTAPDDAGTTIDPSGSPNGASSSVNIGAVIGGTAGGILAVALFFFVIMFFIRRRRRNAENFDPVSFRKSGVMMNDNGPDPFNPRPPTMIERHLNGHNVAPSISSMTGAGMAGAGAYSAHGHDNYTDEPQYPAASYPVQQHQPTQPIQPRQQYTYGQSYGHETGYEQQGSDHGHDAEYNGAYSAEPQVQDIYAAEAYAYPGDEVVVSPGMHAQEMGYGDAQQQDSYQQYQQYQQHQHQQHADAYGGM